MRGAIEFVTGWVIRKKDKSKIKRGERSPLGERGGGRQR